MDENPRAEAERLLGVAEKLLQSKDFNGTREFAVLAQETEPLLEGSDQILAVADVLLASENRINNHYDWYAILEVDRRSEDLELIKKQYRRLALLLHPAKNKFPLADQAFKLVADAWGVLSDAAKKFLYDSELSLYSKVEISNSGKLPVRKTQPQQAGSEDIHRNKMSSFWTTCPYCYMLYEYPRVYEDCCLRCQNCRRAFHGALLPSIPPLVPGRDAYYCYWSFFPLGFLLGGGGDSGRKDNTAAAAATATPFGFPNWMPTMFPPEQQMGDKNGGVYFGGSAPVGIGVSNGSGARPQGMEKRKRGRPRKT